MRILLLALLTADVLTIRQFPDPVRMAVYELPPIEGHADQIARVEAALKQMFPQAEVMDAVPLEDAALRARLKGPFVLMTLLQQDSRLLC